MRILFPALAFAFLAASGIGAPVPRDADKFAHVDLQPNGNHQLKKSFGPKENVLTGLEPGETKFEGIPFMLGEKTMVLGSKMMKGWPEKIAGVKVDKSCTKMHILHATQFGGGAADKPGYEKDDTTIGEYIVHYEDKTSASIPIVYGKDVCDWFYVESEEGPRRGKVVWNSENSFSKGYGAKIRLYLTTWTNPHPEKKIVDINYVSRKDSTPCGPFCLAITLEQK